MDQIRSNRLQTKERNRCDFMIIACKTDIDVVSLLRTHDPSSQFLEIGKDRSSSAVVLDELVIMHCYLLCITFNTASYC